jgi:hypothetical protein
MALQSRIAQADNGAIGFDTTVPLNSTTANTYFSQNFRFCIRYVSRNDAGRQYNARGGTADLSVDETAAIMRSGLALMVVQHVAQPPWSPTSDLGHSYGRNAATYAAEGGLLPGAVVWLDLEGIAEGTAHQDIIHYCNEWFAAVTVAGYVPGVYIGYDVWLTEDELYFDLRTQHYWRADGDIPNVSYRGYQIFQNIKNPNTPAEFDRNVIKLDDLDGLPTWMVAQDPPVA